MTFIDQAQLRERLVTGGKTVVADFTADWCPPCRAIAPELDILEARYADVEFVKIDADANAELVNELGILGIPTVDPVSPAAKRSRGRPAPCGPMRSRSA